MYTQHPVSSGPKAWECSRLIGGDGRLGREHVTESFGRLMVAVGEFCRRRSVTEIISILETAAVTQFQTQGYRCEPLGLPVRFETDKGPSDAIATIIRPRPAGAARDSSPSMWVDASPKTSGGLEPFAREKTHVRPLSSRAAY